MKKYLCLFLTVALVSNHGFSQIRSPSDQLSESDNSQGAQINLVIDRQYVQTNPESLIENFRPIILDKLKRNEVDENFLIESSRRFQLETQGRGSDFKILIHKAILKELNEVQSKLKNILDKELGDGLMGIALPLSFLA